MKRVETLKTVSKHLTTAQVKALNTTAIELIPAPGAGKVISVIDFVCKLTFGSAAFDATIDLKIGNSTVVGTLPQSILENFIEQAASKIAKGVQVASLGNVVANDGISIKSTADSVAGGGSIDIYVTYNVIEL